MTDRTKKGAEDLENYREELLAENEALRKDIDGLEADNFATLKQIKELEIQLLQKNKTIKELSSSLHEEKKRLVRFVTEESNLKSELDLLEIEKGRIITVYNGMSQECGDNISSLNNTILKIDFIKGEIDTLKGKVRMMEEEADEKLMELGSLEEKLSWASKSFHELYASMKDMEKEIKIKYYAKE